MNIDLPRREQFPSLRSLWQEAFGDTEEYLDNFGKTAFSPSRCRLVTIDGKVAAALYWFDCLHENKPIAYLYAVATAKEFQRQGLCHTLIDDTHMHLAKLGYEGAILVPGSKELFDFYQKMGYQTSCHLQKIHCFSATTEVSIRSIDKEEYARLRRKLLPPGGVIQEKENLDFLQTQVKLYAGIDFIIAAVEDAHTLHGVELLGNIASAGKIVRALGYQEGTFRTPGGNIPFAMYHSLGDSKLSPPSYFGLAFD